MSNTCIIPVRKGSERLPKKNYKILEGKSILEIAILKAIESEVFDEIYINTDDELLEKVSEEYGIKFHHRDVNLANSDATSDQVVFDFFNTFNCSNLFWLNTVSPLQTIEDIRNFVRTSKKQDWKSGVSYSPSYVHSFHENTPINFEWSGGFAKTQDLKPIDCLNYAMMGWSSSMIPKLKDGQLFDENTTLVESSRWSNYLLKTQEDFEIIKLLYKNLYQEK